MRPVFDGRQIIASWVKFSVINLGRQKAMAVANLRHLAEQHLGPAVPGHLGEFVHRSDQQGRRATVDFLIYYHHRQPFLGRVPLGEFAAAHVVAAVSDATADVAGCLIHSKMLFPDLATAPGA